MAGIAATLVGGAFGVGYQVGYQSVNREVYANLNSPEGRAVAIEELKAVAA